MRLLEWACDIALVVAVIWAAWYAPAAYRALVAGYSGVYVVTELGPPVSGPAMWDGVECTYTVFNWSRSCRPVPDLQYYGHDLADIRLDMRANGTERLVYNVTTHWNAVVGRRLRRVYPAAHKAHFPHALHIAPERVEGGGTVTCVIYDILHAKGTGYKQASVCMQRATPGIIDRTLQLDCAVSAVDDYGLQFYVDEDSCFVIRKF